MTTFRVTTLLLAGALAVGGCRNTNERAGDEVVPSGAIPAPPEGINTGPSAQPGASNLPSGTQLPGEPPLQGGAGIPADTPVATSPAVPPRE
jgi:hypothetical protein